MPPAAISSAAHPHFVSPVQGRISQHALLCLVFRSCDEANDKESLRRERGEKKKGRGGGGGQGLDE